MIRIFLGEHQPLKDSKQLVSITVPSALEEDDYEGEDLSTLSTV